MISEWLRVMLEEIARKKAEAEQARIEEQRRRDEPRSGNGRVVIESRPCSREQQVGDVE